MVKAAAVALAVATNWRREMRRLSSELPLTPALSPSDGERVSEGRVRGKAVLLTTLLDPAVFI
jgi:hypothetical protein